jgi:hypothetical protein
MSERSTRNVKDKPKNKATNEIPYNQNEASSSKVPPTPSSIKSTDSNWLKLTIVPINTKETKGKTIQRNPNEIIDNENSFIKDNINTKRQGENEIQLTEKRIRLLEVAKDFFGGDVKELLGGNVVPITDIEAKSQTARIGMFRDMLCGQIINPNTASISSIETIDDADKT